MKTAFVFPGQGSQYVGMGKDILEVFPAAREIMNIALTVTGVNVEKLALEGPMSELTRTSNLQPVLTAVDMICCAALRARGVGADAVAGHSLGEYAALWAAGVLNPTDTFILVRDRGRLMDQAASANPGGMAAIIGLHRDELQEMVDEIAGRGVLTLANHNSMQQIVVTGEKDLVSALCKAVKASGKRAIPLKVSGAYHSPLMQEAAEEFRKVVQDLVFSDARIPFYSNVTAEPETDGDRIRELMVKQIISPVRWFDIVNRMYQDGVRLFIELGPKNVLSGLIRKSLEADDYQVINVEDAAGLEKAVEIAGK